MIVIIGLTAIASFVTPINEFGTSLRILGFPMMLAASWLGFFGIAITLMLIFIHLCKLETLGVPYFTLFGPFHGKDNFKGSTKGERYGCPMRIREKQSTD